MTTVTVVERTTVLEAEPPEVFAAVHSEESAPLIDPSVRVWKPDTHPIGVGTRFTIRGRLGRLPIRGVSEVVTWEPPTFVRYRSVQPVWPFRMTADHRSEAIGGAGGRTRYTWTIRFHEVSILGRPLIVLGPKLFTRPMAAQAEALATHLAAGRDVR